jgi:hypothetical protein
VLTTTRAAFSAVPWTTCLIGPLGSSTFSRGAAPSLTRQTQREVFQNVVKGLLNTEDRAVSQDFFCASRREGWYFDVLTQQKKPRPPLHQSITIRATVLCRLEST